MLNPIEKFKSEIDKLSPEEKAYVQSDILNKKQATERERFLKSLNKGQS